MKAAVLYEPNTPLRVEELEIAEPRAGEVLVRVAATGVCHSDYHYMSGKLQIPLPIVLGHEGAGIVESVGPGVTSVEPGEHVIFVWRASCGRCEYCRLGRPALCSQGRVMRAAGSMRDGTTRLRHGEQEIKHFLGVSCFAEQAVVLEDGVVPIPKDVPFEVAALIGCSVITGFGAVLNAAEVRPGDSVLVIGAGGVGLCCVMAARLVGAGRIIAADLEPHKLEFAREFGATDVIDASQEAVPEAVRRLTGEGVDHAFEVIGNPQTVSDAVASLRRAGTATIVGLAPADAMAAISPADLVLQEKKIQGSLYGSAPPHTELPRLVELYRSGQIPLDKLITHRYPLDEINEAYEALLTGDVARSVLVMG